MRPKAQHETEGTTRDRRHNTKANDHKLRETESKEPRMSREPRRKRHTGRDKASQSKITGERPAKSDRDCQQRKDRWGVSDVPRCKTAPEKQIRWQRNANLCRKVNADGKDHVV